MKSITIIQFQLPQGIRRRVLKGLFNDMVSGWNSVAEFLSGRRW